MASHSRPPQSCPAATVTPITYRHMARLHVLMSCSCIRICWFWISLQFDLFFVMVCPFPCIHHAAYKQPTLYRHFEKTHSTGLVSVAVTTYWIALFIGKLRSACLLCSPFCNDVFCDFNVAWTNRQATFPNILVPIYLLHPFNLQLGSKWKNNPKNIPKSQKKQQINKYATMPQQVKHIQCPMFFTLEAGGARRNHSPHALWKYLPISIWSHGNQRKRSAFHARNGAALFC